MRKWTVTALVAIGLAVAALYVRAWLPVVVPWLQDRKNADLLKSLTSIVQIVLWVAASVAFMIRLWRPKRAKDSPAPTLTTVNQQSGGINVSSGAIAATGDLVGRDKITIIQRAAAPVESGTALHQLPAPPADFTGRADELADLLKSVKTGGVTISGLQGLGGVGKTALALKLAEQLKKDYPDAQFYLDLKGINPQPLTSQEVMAHVIRAYHPTAQLPEDAAQLAALYRSVLEEKRALLLMDNARDSHQVQPLIPPRGCLLLVTSRQHFTLPGLLEKNLDALSPGDAQEFLLRVAPRLGTEKQSEVNELAQLCGYLPLALRAVGSALQEKKNISPADYIQRLADAQQRLKLTQTDAVLQTSYELLSETLKERFRLLAVFSDTFDQTAATAVWKTQSDRTQDSLGDLLGYSLVNFDETSRRYSLHDLVRLFADSKLSDEERTAIQRHHAGHYLLVLASADELYLKGDESVTKGLALFDLEWGNIQAGQAWATARAASDDSAAELCCWYAHAGLYCLDLRRHPQESIQWLEPALAAARRLKRREWEGNTVGNLGNFYVTLGDHRRAAEYHEQALVIHRELGDRGAEANDLASLGAAYHSLGEYHRAIEYHEQALVIHRELRDRRAEAHGLGNLGTAYNRLGEHRRAIEYHEQALVIARETGDRRGEGHVLGNLGNAYHGLGEYRRAIEYQEQHLKIAREIGDRRGEAIALGNLGVAYYGLGEYRRAIEYYEQQLEIAREIGQREGEGNALSNSALAFDKLPDRRAAVARADAALKIFEAIESPHASILRQLLAKWREEEKGKGRAAE